MITDVIEYRQAATDTIAYTRNLIAQYGDVCEASFTGIKNYMIHDPEVIKEILTVQGPNVKRTYLFRAFRKFLGDGLFTSDGESHKRQRRLIKPAFYPQRIEGYAAIMVQCANDEMDTWNDGDLININKAMTRITMQVITKTMFGAQLEKDKIEKVGKMMSESFGLMNDIVQNPFYTYCLIKGVKIPMVKKLLQLKAEVHEIIDGFIAAYRSGPQEGRNDLITMLMEARDEDTGEGMTDEHIRDEVLTFFLAGHETTTLALTWSWYMIGQHPEIGQKMYEEVKTVVNNRSPTAGDYHSMPVVKNIFKETLRLYPPAWTFARETMEDMVIKDYHFPKGAVLWTITYLVQRDGKYFHSPDEFIPDRWNEEKIKELPKYAYFPFGGGNRMCIGEGFAWMEGVLVLATIASRFKLQLQTGFTTAINPLFSLKTRENVMMTAQKIN